MAKNKLDAAGEVKFKQMIHDELFRNADRLEVKSDNTRAHAAAIGISALMILRSAARVRPLTEDDIQTAIDATVDGYKVEEYRSPMGMVKFRAKK